jgi:hypothetical protein
MSTYVREKVLRIPIDKLDVNSYVRRLKRQIKGLPESLGWMLKEMYLDFENYIPGKFMLTAERYIDYYLEYELDYNSDSEYNMTRTLNDNEKTRYLHEFKKLDPNVDMDDVFMVEICRLSNYKEDPELDRLMMTRYK